MEWQWGFMFKHDIIIFWHDCFTLKTFEWLLWYPCWERWLWKMTLVFPGRTDLMETRQEAKEPVWRLLAVENQMRDGGPLSEQSSGEHGRKEMVEMYLKGGKTELGEWWIGSVWWKEREEWCPSFSLWLWGCRALLWVKDARAKTKSDEEKDCLGILWLLLLFININCSFVPCSAIYFDLYFI